MSSMSMIVSVCVCGFYFLEDKEVFLFSFGFLCARIGFSTGSPNTLGLTSAPKITFRNK